jgi:hypothetical protein
VQTKRRRRWRSQGLQSIFGRGKELGWFCSPTSYYFLLPLGDEWVGVAGGEPLNARWDEGCESDAEALKGEEGGRRKIVRRV